MAEIHKLSAGKALDKLRGNAPESKSAQRDNKISALEEETPRMSAMRRRLELDQQAAKAGGRGAEAATDKNGNYTVSKRLIITVLVGALFSFFAILCAMLL